jgi:hypothetical protein
MDKSGRRFVVQFSTTKTKKKNEPKDAELQFRPVQSKGSRHRSVIVGYAATDSAAICLAKSNATARRVGVTRPPWIVMSRDLIDDYVLVGVIGVGIALHAVPVTEHRAIGNCDAIPAAGGVQPIDADSVVPEIADRNIVDSNRTNLYVSRQVVDEDNPIAGIEKTNWHFGS